MAEVKSTQTLDLEARLEAEGIPFGKEGAEKVVEDRILKAIDERDKNSTKVSPIHGYAVGGKLAERNAEAKAAKEESKDSKPAAKKVAPSSGPARN